MHLFRTYRTYVEKVGTDILDIIRASTVLVLLPVPVTGGTVQIFLKKNLKKFFHLATAFIFCRESTKNSSTKKYLRKKIILYA